MADTRSTPTAPAEAPRPPAAAAHREADRPVTDLEGAIDDAPRLLAAGATTMHELEAADASDLGKRAGLGVRRVQELQAQARLLDVAGVGPRVAHALVAAGVRTIPDLANADPQKVAEAVARAAVGGDVTPTPQGLRNAKAWVRTARNHPATRPDAPPPPSTVAHERIIVIPTRLYWTVLGLSVLFLAIAVGFYRDTLDTMLFGASLVFYWITLVLAIIVIAWATFGLLRRGRVVHRTAQGTKALVTGVADGFRERSDENEGAMGRFASKWAARFAALSRAIVWIVKLPFRIIIWAWYTAEKLAWRIMLVLYDLVYYPTYTAWLLIHWAVRTSLRILAWALRVVWKVLKVFTKLPVAKTVWRKRMRPKILARWRAMVAAHAATTAKRIDRGRRLAQLRGENPDRWQADHKHRRGFPLPHPEKGRVRIRKRINHISAVQKARREGKPIPRSRPAKEGDERGRFKLRRPKAATPEAEALDFLTPSLRARMEAVLVDGRVDEDERRNLVAAIESEETLTPDQKDRVRRVVEAWSGRDRAASA